MTYQQPLPSYINKLPNHGGYTITAPSGQVGLLKPTQNGNYIYIPPAEIDHPEQPDVNETPPPFFINNDDNDSNGDD